VITDVPPDWAGWPGSPVWPLSWCWGGPDLHWSERILVPPPFEPVTLAQVKQRLRIVSTADDADLSLLIKAARQQVERDTAGVLVGAVISQSVDAPPACSSVLKLVRFPVLEVRRVTTYDMNGVGTDLDVASYRLDAASRPARLILTGTTWPRWPTLRPQDAVVVEFAAGYVLADQNPPTTPVTPETWQLAVLLLVQHWWDRLRQGLTSHHSGSSEGGAGRGEMPVPYGYDMLITERLEWLT